MSEKDGKRGKKMKMDKVWIFGKNRDRYHIAFEALSKNPVISADLLDSCHSFIRGIRDKISTKRSRMMANATNYTNLSATKSSDFTGLEQIIPINRKNHLVEICVKQRFGMDGG
jgi:hypothetical protein